MCFLSEAARASSEEGVSQDLHGAPAFTAAAPRVVFRVGTPYQRDKRLKRASRNLRGHSFIFFLRLLLAAPFERVPE